MAQIAVDIDSTLYDFETPSRNAFMDLARDCGDEYQQGAYQPWNEWRSPADACGLEAWLEVIKMVHAPEAILSRSPFPGAVDTCQALADAGHRLLYISARNAECVQPTIAWIAKSGFPFDDPHTVSCVQGDKRAYMADCEFLIDDRPKTVVDFVYDYDWKQKIKLGLRTGQRKAFVKAYLYNQSLSDIGNVYVAPTWYSIRHYLEKKGVL